MEARSVVRSLETSFRLARLPVSGVLLGLNIAQLSFSNYQPSQGKIFRTTTLYSPLPHGQVLTDRVVAEQFSPSRQYRLIVREGEKKEHQFFELWHRNRVLVCKDVKTEHRQVLYHENFGKFSWSADERTILYVAEKKRDEEASIWNSDTADKNLWRENFGESLSYVSNPGLFTYNWRDNQVTPVNTPPEIFPVYPAFHPSEPEFIYVGYEKSASILGVRHMINRPTKLYRSKLGGESKVLPYPSEYMAVLWPSYSSEGRVVMVGVPHTLAHNTYCALLTLDPVSSEISTLLPVKETSEPDFSGFSGSLSTFYRGGWLSTDSYIFESPHRSNASIFTVTLSGQVKELNIPFEKPYHSELLDIWEGRVLIKVASSVTQPQVFLYDSSTDTFQLLEANQTEPVTEDEQAFYDSLKRVQTQVLKHRDTDLESVLHWSKPDAPLILLLHGGPHGTISHDYTPSRAHLLHLGYNLLNVIFRGSTGFGRSQLETLIGEIGTMDVADVLQAVEEAKEIVDVSRLVAVGGSHGGFLSAHLATTGRLAASVVVNGVIDIASMSYTTDIPDWCFAETARSTPHYPRTDEETALMHRKSPISKVDKVNCPTLIVVGWADLRVPPAQSMEWFRALKELKQDVTFVSFPQDNHSIETPASAFEYVAYQASWIFNKVRP